MWLIPFREKLSFPNLDFIVRTMLTHNIIVASEKYEFNKQIRNLSSHISYWIHIGDKSFLPSVDGPDSWNMKQFGLPLVKIKSLHQCLSSLVVDFFLNKWWLFCETGLRTQNATCTLLYISNTFLDVDQLAC